MAMPSVCLIVEKKMWVFSSETQKIRKLYMRKARVVCGVGENFLYDDVNSFVKWNVCKQRGYIIAAMYVSFVSKFKFRNSSINEKASVTIKGLVETGCKRQTKY